MTFTEKQLRGLAKLRELAEKAGPIPSGFLAIGPMPLAYFTRLDERLWPENYKSESPVAMTATRKLTPKEWEDIKYAIGAHELMTNMFCANMFGGYGMYVYGPPQIVGEVPDIILTLVEDNLPELTRFEEMEGKTRVKRLPGCGSDFAWEEFSQFTHSEQNIEWLKYFKLELPRSRGHYDY